MKSWLVLGSVGCVLLGAGSALAESWHPLARSQHNAFLAEVDTIVIDGEVTSIQIATVSLRSEAGDYSHSVETFQFRCAAGGWRTAGVVEYGADGVESGRYPEEASPWEDARPGTQPTFIRTIACDGARANPPYWTTLKAFIDGGRS